MKKIYLLLLILFLVVIISGCGCVRSKNSRILDFDTCQSECIIEGYNDGSCLSYFEAEGKASDIGNCVIENSGNCGDKGLCHCYCFYKEKDDLDFLLEDISRQTNLNFEDIQITEMEWKSQYGKLMLDAKGFRILQISENEIEKIDKYYIDNDFTLDEYNEFSSSVSEITGYLKDDIACLVQKNSVLDEQDQPDESALKILKIRCAKYNN